MRWASLFTGAHMQLVYGSVIESYPAVQVYRVIVAGADRIAYSADPHRCFTPGMLVLCMQTRDTLMILHRCIPGKTAGELHLLAPHCFGSGVGINDDDFYAGLPALNVPGVFAHAATNIDELPGDYTIPTAPGGGLLVSDFMSSLSASPVCGVWTYWKDRTLRLHGHNLDEYTGTSARRVYMNRGRAFEQVQRCLYPYEPFGVESADAKTPFTAADTGADTGAETTPPLTQTTPAFWRRTTGYAELGDIEHDRISVKTPQGTFGVFEERKSADGAYTVRSAKSLLFEKRVPFPVPEPRIEIDTPGKVEPSETKPWDWGQSEWTAANVADYVAHTLAWDGTKVERELPEHWELRADSNPIDAGDSASADAFYAKLPAFKDFTISQGRDVRYYRSCGHFGLLDDGTFVASDGYGSSITMSRGHIVIRAALDVQIIGRTVLALGTDVVMKAKDNLELSSSTKDVRIKAERNVQALAGNSGQGGILLESKGLAATPDMSTAGDAAVANGVILKTGDNELSVTSLGIVGNAETGVGVSLSGVTAQIRGEQLATIDAPTVLTRFSKTQTSINTASMLTHPGSLVVEGNLAVTSSIVSKGSVVARSVAHDGEGATLLGGAKGSGADAVDTARRNVKVAEKSLATATAEAEKRVLELTQSPKEFSFRKDHEYPTEGFALHVPQEAAARATGWTEPAANGTHPYPGAVWNEDGSAIVHARALTTDDGTAVPLSEIFNDPDLEPTTSSASKVL